MAYGRSIGLSDTNDLDFNPATNTFNMISDTENLTQAIMALLKTLKGENKFFPEFGVDLPQLLERNISDDNIKHAIIIAVGKDPRIKTIDKVLISRDKRTLNIEMKVTTNQGAVLDIRDKLMW